MAAPPLSSDSVRMSARNELVADFSLVIVAVLLATLVSARQFLLQRELLEIQQQVTYQSLHDGLTGLPNRTLVIDRAEQLMARARRDHIPVAALYLDIDGFKTVNDKYGHAAGDALLLTVATEGHPVCVTASIGIAAGPRRSADELFRDADEALYKAKAAGRNRWVRFQ